MSELAKQVHRTKSTVTALVEKLERNGYVLRIPDPEDSRGVLGTPDGQGARTGTGF